jgi:hypothetical protein
MPDSMIDQVEDLLEAEVDLGQGDSVEDVAKLLQDPEGGQAAEPIGDDETEQEAAPEEAPEPEKDDGVDYSAEIPMSDGSKVNLGALKDAYQDSQAQTLAIQERENVVMSQMNELQEMSQYTQLPPEKMQAIKQQQERYMNEQHGLMLEAIPEFKDQATFAEAKKGIEALATEYGISDAVAQIADHKIVKLLNDFAKLRQGIKAAKDNVKPLRSKEPKSRNRAAGKVDATTAAAQQAAKTGSRSDQIRAINELLN